MTGNHLRMTVFLALLSASPAFTQPTSNPGRTGGGAPPPRPPDLTTVLTPPGSEMRTVTQRYEADRDQLSRFYGLPSPTRFSRMERFYGDWLAAVQKLDASKLSEKARADRDSLIQEIQKDTQQLATQAATQAEISPAVPFAGTVFDLYEGQLRMQKPDAEKTAAVVDDLAKAIQQTQKGVDAGLGATNGVAPIHLAPGVAGRAVASVNDMRRAFTNWFGFYNEYDPMFTWWMARPFKDANQALADYARFLREKGDAEPSSAGTITETVATPVYKPAELPFPGDEVPDLQALLSFPQSEMRGVIQRYQTDSGGGRGGGGRRGGGRTMTKDFYDNWLGALAKLDFDSLSRNGQVDYLLLKNRLVYSRDRLAMDNTARFMPFSGAVSDITNPRGDEKPDPVAAAAALKALEPQIESAQKSTETEWNGPNADRAVAVAASRAVANLQSRLQDWYDNGESLQSNWEDKLGGSYQGVDKALKSYVTLLRGTAQPMAAQPDGSDIVGAPIGRDALMVELEGEMVDDTPEELIARAEKEYAWCETELKKASREMGYGDDWKKALEKVKNDHVPAGDQPYLIRDLINQSLDFIGQKNLITIPEVARETLRMEMMSPERQLVNPFFTGGQLISVSYPTDTMTQEEKEESMRGNNNHFSRATVFHELLPGHNLQWFMAARVNGYRGMFNTPFWGEGWACYWELFMYQEGFPRSPEDRIGMLFWRLHRCARIIFSLNFHLGKWTPKQCIDLLVDGVGHEQENAVAEVRRSFGGGYSPLYQCAYLVGALQLMDLHKELVDSGKMTDAQFHDAIIAGNSMPIAMVKAGLIKDKLTPDYKPNWKF
jgi:uncharacterized protein (DUF885 family)